MQSILEILTLSTDYLKRKGIANARRQSEELICDALNLSRLQLYLDFERPLTSEELVICRERLVRRSHGEPLQYIQGKVEFYHCTFSVNPDVLIPRQETEVLVNKISTILEKEERKGKVLWDVCCGSGCIGIALKKQFPELDVFLSDISPAALKVAADNAKLNEVQVHLLEGDLLNPFQGRQADFFVCNPPYIAKQEYLTLDVEVRRYEPQLALVGGEKGVEFYERLACELPPYLAQGARLWFEIGYQQGESVKALFQEKPWKNQNLERDWSGHDRFFFLENE